jgi:hypothetical protein
MQGLQQSYIQNFNGKHHKRYCNSELVGFARESLDRPDAQGQPAFEILKRD